MLALLHPAILGLKSWHTSLIWAAVSCILLSWRAFWTRLRQLWCQLMYAWPQGASCSADYSCECYFQHNALLLQVGYPCLSLHGGKDQLDRESTIKDFKTDVCNVLVATSVAARGLDVKDLKLVVNYVVPNHHEDYVHRVGRTGEQR